MPKTLSTNSRLAPTPSLPGRRAVSPRRHFLRQSTAVCALVLLSRLPRGAQAAPSPPLDFPLIDFHVHLDNSTVDKVLELARERGVKFGIVEHAGTRENKYPVVLSNDAELLRWIEMLNGKPVFKGIQAEWIDWMGCFSPEALSRLDFVLSDAMTIRGKDGRRMKLWEKDAEIGEKQSFMDRYVDWHVEIMATEPLDILANTTWLPATLLPEYDALWTDVRMAKVIAAAAKHKVALEISSSYQLPKLPFLKLAKAAGVKFSFGSNGRYPNMGKLDYCIAMAQALDLARSEMFMPAAPSEKPYIRRQSR
jgi:histidinol phosphatase-like PHP family hydrolase